MRVFPIVRPALFALEAERAHGLTIAMLKALQKTLQTTGIAPPKLDPRLAIRVAGLEFPNPIGLAAGVDKNGEVPDAFLALGFGFAEVGTLTPLPQVGNPRPRLFRLPEDRAVINRLGFNNGGQAAARRRLARRAPSTELGTGPSASLRLGILGINIGANKEAVDRVGDYEAGVRAMAPVADYLTVNVSSPNTPGLRLLQEAAALDELLGRVMAARGAGGPPIFLKVAPDLAPAEVDAVARVAIERGVDALIVSNTTLSRPPLTGKSKGEAGGLSGAPLKDLASRRLRDCRTATGGAIPLIAAGGIASGADAYARILAGASLIQLYTALVYEGPLLARRIARDLAALLARDGHATLASAVGSAG